MRGVALKLEDLFLKLPSLVYERALAREIIAALNVLLHEQVCEAGNFLVEDGNVGAKRRNGRCRALFRLLCVFLRHTLHFLRPLARQVEARKQIGKFRIKHFFAQICTVACAALFRAVIIHIAVHITVLLMLHFLLRSNGTSALTARKQSAIHLWVVSRRAIFVASRFQYFLHLIKKFFGNNWSMRAVVHFARVAEASDIKRVGEQECDLLALQESPAAFRPPARSAGGNPVLQKKACNVLISLCAERVHLKCFADNRRFLFVYDNSPRAWVIQIAERRDARVHAASRFSAQSTRHIHA